MGEKGENEVVTACDATRLIVPRPLKYSHARAATSCFSRGERLLSRPKFTSTAQCQRCGDQQDVLEWFDDKLQIVLRYRIHLIPKLDVAVPRRSNDLGTFMAKPLMSNDNLVMALQSRLYPTSLVVPEHDIALAITTANPLAVW
jgi:hypothetical protein